MPPRTRTRFGWWALAALVGLTVWLAFGGGAIAWLIGHV